MVFEDKKVIFLLAVTSDIGKKLAINFLEEGNTVIGTCRSKEETRDLNSYANCHLFHCDLADKFSINSFFEDFRKLNLKWDLFISCVGTQNPIGSFFDCDFSKWEDSVSINAIKPLEILHKIYPFRNQERESNVIFFAGGGVNNSVKNYSAYTASKVFLIKMCELLDFENNDMGVFIIGPGWVKTKIHKETLNEKKEIVGDNYDKTAEFMKTGNGTDINDIFDCINWLCEQGKPVSGGRNFSVVYDSWKGKDSKYLAEYLKSDSNMYKLRRQGNNWNPSFKNE